MTEPLTPTETIARELEALGEEPLGEDELAMLAAEGIDDEPAVASTARLIELSQPFDAPPLSELERARVWKKVEQRRGNLHGRGIGLIAAGEPSGRTWSPWLGVAVAIAAALVLWVALPGDDSGKAKQPSATEVAEVGEQARSALRALDDGLDDTARAERLTKDYQRRLEATR